MILPRCGDLWRYLAPIMAFAGIFDSWIHIDKNIKIWREKTKDWWCELEDITWRNYSDVHKIFYDLYSSVYGEKWISRRRLIASGMSSMIFVFLFYWIIVEIGLKLGGLDISKIRSVSLIYKWVGYDAPTISYFHYYRILEIFGDALITNLLPDIISIIETGWVLNIAKDRPNKLIELFCLDLVLTTLIWFVSLFIFWVLTYYFVNSEIVPFAEIFSKDQPEIFAYILSTYSTSFIWFGFLIFVIGIAYLKKISKIIAKILESNWMANLPITMTTAFLCALCYPILIILRLIFVR